MLVAQQRFDPFDRLFEVFGTEPKAEYLVQEDKDAWTYEIDMPGVAKESLQIQISGRELQITGKRKNQERKYSLILPQTARKEAVKAALDLGVLRITVPKSTPTTVQVLVE